MIILRLVLVLAGVAVAVPASVQAVDGSGDGAIDADRGTVAALAADAADALEEERELLAGEDTAALRRADDRGHDLLIALDTNAVRTTQAARDALGPLSSQLDGEPLAPPDVVYTAAIADLRRIAETPAAALPRTDRGIGIGLYLGAVAALAAVGLGAALGSRRWSPADPDDEWRDEATGLASRRRLDHDLATHDGSPTAVLLLDVQLATAALGIDDDTRADALWEVGDAIARHVRTGDVVYRSGEHEFCVLLVSAAKADVHATAHRVARAVSRVELPGGSSAVPSIGIATGEDGLIADAVLGAGAALGTAQRAGGGRVVEFEHPELEHA